MPQPKTDRLEARITEETARQVRDLARLWGPVRPLNQTEVAVEAIRRAWQAEKARERKK